MNSAKIANVERSTQRKASWKNIQVITRLLDGFVYDIFNKLWYSWTQSTKDLTLNKQTNKPLDSEIFWKGPQKLRAVFIILIVLLKINHLFKKKTKKKKTSWNRHLNWKTIAYPYWSANHVVELTFHKKKHLTTY